MAADSRIMNGFNPMRTSQTVFALFTIMALAIGLPQRLAAFDPFAEYDMVMYVQPDVQTTVEYDDFQDGLLELWTRAINRPDAELQRMVIDSMAIAHKGGMKGVDALRPTFLEMMKAPDQSLNLVRSAANAVIAIDSKEDAEQLAQAAIQHGGTVAQIVEPALAKWKSPVMKAAWLDRMRESSSSNTLMLFAIQGLAEIEAPEARDGLVKLLDHPGAPASIRMASARALAIIDSQGLVELATKLEQETTDSNPLGALLAIEVLGRRRGTEASDLLNRLLGQSSHAVQAGALMQLLRIDPKLVEVHVDEFIGSPDANVRAACARAMIETKQIDRIAALSSLLDDENPSLRREVATGLLKLAEAPELRDEVLKQVSNILANDSWRGVEQAAVILAKLDHQAAGPRMVKLLAHERGEVRVATAWGLTQLRMTDLLPGMLEHAQSVYDGFKSGKLNDDMPGYSDQVAHLFIAMGNLKYAEGESLMRSYLPKNMHIGRNSRPAAAWALGLIYEDKPQEDLVTIILERLNDSESLEPEMTEVRQMCAISLGRMKAESALPDLRKHADSAGWVARASAWSIERMTGEPAPSVPPIRNEIGGWFLSPIQSWSE